MNDNFDLRKYLIENKATTNSKMLDEAYVTPEGSLEDFKPVKLPTSQNSKYDKAFTNLINVMLDNLIPNTLEEPRHKLADVLETLNGLIFKTQLAIQSDPEEPIRNVINPTTELDFALVAAVEATGKKPQEALGILALDIQRLLATYNRLLRR